MYFIENPICLCHTYFKANRKEVSAMKVFINLNHGSEKGLLLSLSRDMSLSEIKRIVGQNNQRDAISTLIMRSSSMVEVSHNNIKNAKAAADFTISDDYTAEKLG